MAEDDLQTAEDYRTLIRKHDTKLTKDLFVLSRNDRYYEGDVPLKYMAPALQAEYGDRIDQLVINAARMVTDAFENRLDVDGIRLDPTGDADDTEQRWWADLDMPAISQQVHLESLSMRTGFAVAGADDGGNPVVTGESPMQVTVLRDPATRQVTSAVKRWLADDARTQMRTLYLPDRTMHWVRANRTWEPADVEVDDHGLGRVPVVEFPNRARMLRPEGICEFTDIIPLYEALNKTATDMMVGAEAHALPRRWATSVREEDFVDENGKRISSWEQIIGRVWTIPPSRKDETEPKVGQFAASDLTNFHSTVRLLLELVAELTGLPMYYVAQGGVNPAAEGAIVASEAQLVKKSERRQTQLGASWKRLWQLVMRIRDGVWSDEAKHLEIIWRNPATPTMAQQADAIVKLATGDRPILPVPFAREKLGYTATERDAMAEYDRQQATQAVAAVRDAFRGDPSGSTAA